jgi:4-hydroxybenzoate polyprenyltransferase
MNTDVLRTNLCSSVNLSVLSVAISPVNIKDISRAIRTRQWAKNALLFGGFIFAGGLRDPWPELVSELTRVLLAFVCFCALSGATYLINDWQDLESDRLHPTKKNRPLAAGRISLRGAAGLFAVLVVIAGTTAGAIITLPPGGLGFGIAALSYFGLTLAYSLRLKHEVIIDVLSVAAGFVVRVIAGCLAIPVAISPWILFCTFTLALFVALCKRRAELLEVGESAGTRHVLKGYTAEMLDTFIAIAAGLTIIAYSLYTFNAPHSSALGKGLDQTPLLMTSIPFVVYGVFRYLLLAHSSPVGGEPEQMLRDRPLMICVLSWGLWVAALTLLPAI